MVRPGNGMKVARGAELLTAVMAFSLLLPGQLVAQRALQAEATPRAANTTQVAWSLPDVNELVERVFRRIVTQDKPGAIPMSDYTQRSYGRDETVNAIRRFTGHDVELAPSAFSAMGGWPTAHGLDVSPCDSTAAPCPPSKNSVWIAITRFERGDTPNELYVWYTTRFSARRDDQPVSNAYAFCERWFRTGGVWRYEGFIRVTSA